MSLPSFTRSVCGRYGARHRVISTTLREVLHEVYFECPEDDEHGDAWITLVFGEHGPIHILTSTIDGTLRYEHFADVEGEDVVEEYRWDGVPFDDALNMWTLLSRGDVARVRAFMRLSGVPVE